VSYGVLAFGDSITNGGGELQWGVALQSWALWLARGLGMPYTSYAVDGATAADVVGEQIPRFSRVALTPDGPFDVGCLYIGVNDVRRPDWDPASFERDLASAHSFLATRCARVLTLTLPLDLGRPRAGANVQQANAIIQRVAGQGKPSPSASVASARSGASIASARSDASVASARSDASVASARSDASVASARSDASVASARSDASIASARSDASIASARSGADSPERPTAFFFVCDLSDFRARNLVMADRVHPTAFGQIAIAERALRCLDLPARAWPSSLITYETTRFKRLRGDLTYAYRYAKNFLP
jgi:lysophospholipase L1-like esterase